MPTWEGRSKTSASGYKFFVWLLRSAGISTAYFILRFVAAWYFLFSHESSKYILYYFRSRMGFGKLQSLRALYRNYYVFGQTLIDKVAMIAGMKVRFTFNFDGVENLEKMATLKKGGLLLSAHAGNYEAAGQMLERLNTRVHIVMYDGEERQVKQYLDSVTGARSFDIILIRPDLSHIFQITQALASNEIVCMHADRFRPEHKTVMHPFLGAQALFPEGPFLLALKLKVPVAFVYGFKETAKHYHFYSSELKYFYEDKNATVSTVLNDFAIHLEKLLKRYPEQWFNYYDFWKP